MTWASTGESSDFKIRREAGLFTIIGFPHAEYVADRATRGVTDDDHTASERAVADDWRSP